MTEIEVIPTPSLGDQSYLLISGDEALVVDPQRDAWRLVAACQGRGVVLRYVLETHVHNDYVSGAVEVRAATGARIVGPAEAHYGFDHLAVADGDEVRLGDLTVRAMRTPGHTPEHTSYLVLGDPRDPAAAPLAVLTGGRLIVGGAGRTDLLGARRADELARAQYRSLQRLALLPDQTWVLPTHGAGSFCAAQARSGRAMSTVGRERRTNPALLAADEDAFVRRHAAGRTPRPTYYRHMPAINRAGPEVLTRVPELPALPVEDVTRRIAAGAWVVDGRDRAAFAAAHLPGSLNVELDDSFASYVGWLVPFGAPLLLVLPDPVPEAAATAVTQLLRIGYEQVAGYLAGGVPAWRTAGLPLRGYPVADATEVPPPGAAVLVLDVRQPSELEAGTIPGSRAVFVGDLPTGLADLPPGVPVWTICASGRRAALAASLLDRAGIPVTAVTRGGVPDWLKDQRHREPQEAQRDRLLR